MIRNIIKIDEDLCTGCGACVNGCPEGAIQLIDGKARLVGEIYCDGLGACIGTCPEDAITVEKREAEPYNEKKTMKNIVSHGENTIIAHLEHLLTHKEWKYIREAIEYLEETISDFEVPEKFIKIVEEKCKSSTHIDDMCGCYSHPAEKSNNDKEKVNGKIFHGCPGSMSINVANLNVSDDKINKNSEETNTKSINVQSQLRNWPIQLKLAPVQAPYFKDADLLIAADCVGSSFPAFHQTFVRGKTLLIGCPKLDNAQYYIEKLAQIFSDNTIRSVTSLIMEVPCCSGLKYIINQALQMAGKNQDIPVSTHLIGINGTIKN